MILSNHYRQKVYANRAALWAEVYHNTVRLNAIRGNELSVPTTQADLAIAEFDKRFKFKEGEPEQQNKSKA